MTINRAKKPAPPKTFRERFSECGASLALCKTNLLNATQNCNLTHPDSDDLKGRELRELDTPTTTEAKREPVQPTMIEYAAMTLAGITAGVVRAIQVRSTQGMSRGVKAVTSAVALAGGVWEASTLIRSIKYTDFVPSLLPLGSLLLAFAPAPLKALGAGLAIGGALSDAQTYYKQWNAGTLDVSFTSLASPLIGDPLAYSIASLSRPIRWVRDAMAENNKHHCGLLNALSSQMFGNQTCEEIARDAQEACDIALGLFVRTELRGKSHNPLHDASYILDEVGCFPSAEALKQAIALAALNKASNHTEGSTCVLLHYGNTTLPLNIKPTNSSSCTLSYKENGDGCVESHLVQDLFTAGVIAEHWNGTSVTF